MSRLIDDLRASDFPDRSPRDLTLEIGGWLEANKRQDVFGANPDFAKEYFALKDEIGRATRPGYAEEFKGAFGAAVDDLQASGYALGALAAHGAKKIGVPGADSVRDNLLRLMHEQEAEAAQYRPSVGSYDEISAQHPIEDAARYATYGLGTLGPSLLQSVTAGLTGAAVGAAAGSSAAPGPGTAAGAVGGALLGLAERKLAQKAVSKLLERGVRNVTLDEAARALPREVVVAEARALATKYAAQGALTLSSIGSEVGSIYAENPEAPGTALAFGVPAGLLDIIPESYVLSRFFRPGARVIGAEASRAKEYFRQVATEAFKTVPMEASTETAQTLLEIAAAKYGRGEPVSFTENDLKQAMNAGIIGAMGGGVMAPVAAAGRGRAEPGGDALEQRVVNGLPLRSEEMPGERAAPLDYAGVIPDAELTSPAGLGPATRTELDRATRGDDTNFAPEDSEPYAMFGGGMPTPPTPEVELPPAVQKAVDQVYERIGEFNRGQQITEAERINADAERARRLADVESALNENDALNRSPAGADALRTRLAIEEAGAPVPTPGPAQQAAAVFEDEFTRTEREVQSPQAAELLRQRLAAEARGPSNVPLGDSAAMPVELAPVATETVAPAVAPDVLPQPTTPPAAAGAPLEAGSPPPESVASQTPAALPTAAASRSDTIAAEGAGAQKMKRGRFEGKYSKRQIFEQRRRVKDLQTKVKRATDAGNSPRAMQFQEELNAQRDLLTQMQADKLTAMAPRVGYAPNGEPDIISDIADHVGRIRTVGTGGENNGWKSALRQGAAQLLRGGEDGVAGDQVVERLNSIGARDNAERGKYNFGSPAEVQAAIEAAVEDRKRMLEAMQVEEKTYAQAEAFNKALERNARGQNPNGAVQADELTVGTTFKIAREKFEVVDVTEDGEVVIDDGPRFGTQTLKPGETIHPDKRTLRRVKIEDVSFLDEDENDTPPAAPLQATPAPTVVLGQPTMPTGEQVARASGNGVKPLPRDSVPNMRRLRIFAQPEAAPAEERDTPIVDPATVESQAVDDNPLVVLEKMVGKLGKTESNVAVVLVDRASGLAYVRGAYRGAGNTLYVDMASSRKGTAIGKGSTVSGEADLLEGTEGRPAMKLFGERLTDGAPRFTIYGVGELVQPGGARNWNAGSAAGLNAHAGVQAVARRWWTDEARKANRVAKLPTAAGDTLAFAEAVAAWRRENLGKRAGEQLRARVREHAELRAKGKLRPPQVEAWADEMVKSIEEMARVQQRQAVLISADYLGAPQEAIDVMRTALRALTEGRQVDVAAFEQAAMGAAGQAARTTGLVLTPQQGRKIVAFGLRSINGPVDADAVLSVLHETAHVITDGLAEPLRVAFQEAVGRMPHGQARWLMNSRSLDIRLLANADPATLAPEQRAALERLTPDEVAAARRIDRGTLIEEQMAEHLAQLGWDRAEAKGAVQTLVRFLKDLWLRLALAVQGALKGRDQVSPGLARAYVENRFLQFIHRDSALGRDRINDLLNWVGVRATERQLVPIFPAGNDWDQRMQYVDVSTGELIPVDHATYTPEAQAAYLRTAIDSAARFIRETRGMADTPALRQTRRAAFTAPLSFTPSLQANTVFAAVNLEEEIYRRIAANADIAPLVPPGDDFLETWLKLPAAQRPEARRAEAKAWASKTTDPLTGAPVAHDAATTVDALPAADEPIVDREGKAVVVKLTEAQDRALQQTIAALSDTEARLQRTIERELARIAELEKMRRRNPADFPAAALKELDALNESVPLRQKIAARLAVERNALLAKFQPADLVNIYPTAEYLTVPAEDANEAQIRAAKRGVVPRDLRFTDKTTFAGHLAAMDAWLRVPENRAKGQIYGIIAEQYRKLNQIPVDLERAGTAGILRRAITGSFADELRASGLPALQNLAKKFFETAAIINAHNDRVSVAGDRWSDAFAKFARAVGAEPDQSFKERVWDPLLRVWNFIDVSERNRLGTEGEGDLFTRMEGALKTAAGVAVDTPAKRAALRALLMETIENERQIRTVYEQQPGLKVRDEEMGVYRRLVSHGLVTGRRSVARHMSGLFMRMNPTWSSDAWEGMAELYETDRAALEARLGELFSGYVVTDFVEPLINNNTQIFEVTDADGVPRRASLLRVREAWAEAEGSVVRFAENLHRLEGGKVGEEGRTLGGVLAAFRRMFNEIKADQDAKNGTEASGHEILPRQMMDARVANDWPAEWVSYATYTKADNLTLLHQLARSAAFGPDAIAATGELSATIREAKRDLDDLYFRFDQMVREGMSPREIERTMGADDYKIARNALKIATNLGRVEQAFRSMSANTNYLAGDFRLLNEALGFASTMMVQNPRGAAINTTDILGSLVALKVSRPALKAQARAIATLAADLGNGVLQAFGQNAAFNVGAAKRRIKAGVRDPDLRTTWREKMANMGPGMSLAKPSGYESPVARVGRVATRVLAKGRDILPNLGSPLQGTSEMQTLSPKLRWGAFPNWAMSTMNANIDAAYEVFADLATRGVEYLQKVPAAERGAFVRELELGIRDLDAEQLGYFGGIILNDRAAFESLKSALETKMAGESGVGRFVAKAWRRQEAAGGGEYEAISNAQFTDIVNYANTEWTLQSNFASLPPWMQSGPLRPLFIFLTWPYNAMRRFGKTFLDADGRLVWWGANSTVADGMKAFFLVAAPAAIAGSFAIDWYDKYILGKKQNLREASWTTAVPVVGAFTDFPAFVERVGRYGSAGFASDIVNQVINYDTQRNLSLDTRIVAINALSSLVNSLVVTPIQQGGNVTYASVGRPFFQAIGGGGVLQYLQVLNNALDLNTQDAAINSRINTGNYLRAAGREMKLPVRVTRGAAEAPTRASPYLQQMELAALVNNAELFRDAYRNAVAAAREDGREDAAKYVAENFTERHPLRRLFRSAPTENEYRRMLGLMGDHGSREVRNAINSYNRYLATFFGKKAYYGKADKDGQSAEELIRAANRINERQGAGSALVIP